ncbi:lipoprotein N-acyltransferase Lnb domain-containing protein [Agrilutibacter solisilvae]
MARIATVLVLAGLLGVMAPALAAAAGVTPADRAPANSTPVERPISDAPPPAAEMQAPPAGGTASAPRIGMMTMQPGQIFWERFGHDSIVVLDPATGEAISYNFGFFDPTEPDFIARFVRGDMRYRLAAVPFEHDLVLYREEGRGVAIQWLDLDDAQARATAAALARNALPENAFYRYDYFKDNCSTRVRDAVDQALGGGLHRQAQGRSQGLTWRDEALRLASPAPWMWLGFDLGLGPEADVPMTLWQQAFVPGHLSRMIGESRNAAGRPLVRATQPLLPHVIPPDPVARPVRTWAWALWGLALGTLALWLGRRHPRALAAAAIPLWIFGGLVGGLLLFLWFGTQHTMGWANHNLFLLNPVGWLALPGAWRILRGRAPGRVFGAALATMAALAAIGMFVHWLPAMPQRNAHWIALLLPVHAALAWAWFRRRSQPAR